MSDLLTTVSSTAEKDYEITKDPFAIFGFALLVTTILLFLFLLLVTARRSSIEVWDSLSHGTRRYCRAKDTERAQEDAVPLMSSDSTVYGAQHRIAGPSQAPKRVRFSDRVDVTTLPTAPAAFDEIFDKWHDVDLHSSEPRTSKRKSISERQLAELCLSSTS